MRMFPATPAPSRGWYRSMAVLFAGVGMLGLGLALAVGPARAQDNNNAPPGDAGDPPARVARLAYREGAVVMMPAGASAWGDASLNRPLTTGDKISTGDDAHAELEFGGGTLRMANDTNASLINLDNRIAQVSLTQGTLSLNVRGLAEGQTYEVDTPTLALVLDQPGIFRVDISEDGSSTRIVAFDGQATVYGENNAQRLVGAGRIYEFNDSTLNNIAVSDLSQGDDFDAWCNDRDRLYANAPSSQYVADGVVGAQDLDRYGNWQPDADYGQVWYPSDEPADWAPYSDGYWSYVNPWGWTWVDASPWGFAPYHYGRWAFMRGRGRWGWVPGPRGVRPVYAPALVAFVGNMSAGGPVGWFPLGPGDIYNPWYHVSRNYYAGVNLANIRVVGGRAGIMGNIDSHYNAFRSGQAVPTDNYANRTAPHAFTGMSGADFASARRVRGSASGISPQSFATAPVMPRGVTAPPNRASFAPAAGRVPASANSVQRGVVARSAPPATPAARSAVSNVRVVGSGVATPAAARVAPVGRDTGNYVPESSRYAPAGSNNPAGNNSNQMRPGLSIIAPAQPPHPQPRNDVTANDYPRDDIRAQPQGDSRYYAPHPQPQMEPQSQASRGYEGPQGGYQSPRPQRNGDEQQDHPKPAAKPAARPAPSREESH